MSQVVEKKNGLNGINVQTGELSPGNDKTTEQIQIISFLTKIF